MTPTSPEISNFPRVLAQDLEDPKLDRFNRILGQLFQQIAAVQGITGPVEFKNAVTSPQFLAQNTSIPKDDAQLLTFGAAKRLFGPTVVRNAIVSGTDVLGTPVQPLPPSINANDILRYDTHANRPSAGSVAAGTFYEETDRNVLYQNQVVSSVNTWVWIAGEMRATQATLPADLGVSDAGFIAQVTDFNHRLKWSGSAWGWAPGDAGSGMMVRFEIDPSPLTGWALYDGSTVTYLKSDGATGTKTLPDLTSAANKAAYDKSGSPNSGPNAAVAPTLNSAVVTGSSATGVTIPANTGANVTGITMPVNTGVDSGGGTVVMAGVGTTVAAHTHVHPEGPLSDPTHVHTEGPISDPGHAHAITATTANADGEPRNLVRRPFFRL